MNSTSTAQLMQSHVGVLQQLHAVLWAARQVLDRGVAEKSLSSSAVFELSQLTRSCLGYVDELLEASDEQQDE